MTTIHAPTPDDLKRIPEADMRWYIRDPVELMYRLQAWIRRAVASEARERATCEVLRSLACWLGVGAYTASAVDAAEFGRKIRDGVESLVRVETQRARGPQISDSEQVLLLRRTVKEAEARERELRQMCELFERRLLESGDPFDGDDWQTMQDIRVALGKQRPNEQSLFRKKATP
jgi:hypothetical protein